MCRLFRTYDNATAWDAAENLPLENIVSEFEAYSKAAAEGKDQFGKTVFPVKTFRPDETLHVAWITPAVHYTMGGLKIDTSARVLFVRSSLLLYARLISCVGWDRATMPSIPSLAFTLQAR